MCKILATVADKFLVVIATTGWNYVITSSFENFEIS